MKNALEVGKAFLRLSQPEIGDTISNLKLQKLLYYAQGFYIAINNKPLFKEDLLRWEYGPVVREVYDEYSSNGANPLPVPEGEVKLAEKEKELIRNVWKVYGQFSAWRLKDMTHNEMPWKSTKRNCVISLAKLKSFFKPLVTES